ncbi:MAG: PQQ-like beta-propeller repeat protein, partial [Armatimonadetes bacterium]|nr:PQQ-like beta-propeller repeat protein [Armatimonadota bacterium]
ETAIMLGSVDTNPAMMVLYSRFFTPVDAICPGPGGHLVQTVHDPFGRGRNVVVVGASTDDDLLAAAEALAEAVAAQPKGNSLKLPRLFTARYGPELLKRMAWVAQPPAEGRLTEGLRQGQRALDEGQHTSIAGILERVAQRYLLTQHSVEAKLFVALWEIYAKSAVADPRKYGGPWGFDSDFPSHRVVAGWDVIEEDPALTDDERLAVTRAMGRWIAEAVAPKVGNATNHVPHNHQTFPGLGVLFAGLYYTQGYETLEGPRWLAAGDNLFRAQAPRFKPHEDCNGYQWLTNGHQFRYAMARPDFTIVEAGSARKIVDFLIGNMDNFGIQVPYGDTGSWRCWDSELICLDIFAFLTDDPAARWAANLKRRDRNLFQLHSFTQLEDGPVPTAYNGVRVWPLEPMYYQSFKEEQAPPVEQCFDKISFRQSVDPKDPYLLLDGLSNGGHKHLDGNSIPRITQFDRIWLADNDYFKAQTKYHNSVLIFKDGQATPIPSYTALVGAGESARYGYSRTRMTGYSGMTWDRAIVWVKPLGAFVVLDKLTAEEPDEYQLRLLWHGVGAPTLSAEGLKLEQKGPSYWIQPGPGPQLSLYNDEELGTNWNGYPHAEPVVRSMTGLARVRLEKGESYLYATVLHGAADGEARPWQLRYAEGADGVVITTEQGAFAVGLGPVDTATPFGRAVSDAHVIVADGEGLSLLGVSQAVMDNQVLPLGDERSSLDLPFEGVGRLISQIPLREPTANLQPGGQAPAHKSLWEQRPQPELQLISGNKGAAGAVDLGVKLTSNPAPAPRNVFNATGANRVEALLDGSTANSTDTSVMFEPDQTITLDLDLGAAVEVRRVKWTQWWATSSSRNTKYLLRKATVAVSNDAFATDRRVLGEVTDAGPHPNFGTPIPYEVNGAAAARYVRLVIEPQPGSAVYLAELMVEGKVPAEVAATPYHITAVAPARDGERSRLLVATVEGEVMAFDRDGNCEWVKHLPGRLNDVVAADTDGDGRDEVAVARQDFHTTLLDHDGQELWSREMKFYRRTPFVNLVRAGDIDGDGIPEIIAGGENWRFYAYRADGTELWNYEAVHPARSGAVADLDGDGKAEVICGTHYYSATVLNTDGTRRWAYSFGPICYDVATGSFDGDKTRGVVFGGGDGIVHYLDSAGKPRLKYNTGDEVRRVATGDLDGDGRDELVAGSLNYNLYCFGADSQRRWRRDLGAAVTALAVLPEAKVVVAGTADGRLVTLDSSGEIVALTDLKAAVVDLALDGEAVMVATDDGRLRRLLAR